MLAGHRWSAVQRTVGVALCAGVVLASGCSSHSGPSTGAGASANSVDVVGLTSYPLAQRQVAPALKGTDLDGQPVSLASLGRDKIVFLNVWASWCGPCRAESPLLARSAKALAKQGVQFLGLDEQDPAAAARAFVASTGTSYPHLVDREGTLLRKLRLLPQMGIPSTLVIDRHGRIAARIIGAVTASEISQIVRNLQTEA
jgi:thiol-disulfide isomerase/thioredoxin